jgi:hypothetical protein
MSLNSREGRQQSDLARALTYRADFEPLNTQLMRVISHSNIDAANFRYLYSVRKAVVNSSGYAGGNDSDPATFNAISVSELSNTGTYVSYGIAVGTLPAGFAPVPIPNDTFVLCVPHRMSNGTLIWLIVNTQGIDGVCS